MKVYFVSLKEDQMPLLLKLCTTFHVIVMLLRHGQVKRDQIPLDLCLRLRKARGQLAAKSAMWSLLVRMTRTQVKSNHHPVTSSSVTQTCTLIQIRKACMTSAHCEQFMKRSNECHNGLKNV